MTRLLRLLLTTIILTSPVLAHAQNPATQQSPPPPLEISDDTTGWTSMFNGIDLNNWDGPKPLWHVEDGAIAVRRSVEPSYGSVYLIWQGGQPRNFEFKFEVKLEGAAPNAAWFKNLWIKELLD